MSFWENASGLFADPAARRALVGGLALAIGAGPLGTFMLLRRMSLASDAMAHAILPGVAAGYFLSGLSVIATTIGGLVAGLVVTLLAGLTSRISILREDASLAAFYFLSLALGFILVELRGSDLDFMEILFGDVMGLKNEGLVLIGVATTATLLGFAIIWRGLIAETLDPQFLQSVGKSGRWVHGAFLTLAVLNLVAGYQVLGTLLCVGLMILPAAAARLWFNTVGSICFLASGIGAVSVILGLLLARGTHLSPGPVIILVCGLAYAISILIAPGGIASSQKPVHKHKTA